MNPISETYNCDCMKYMKTIPDKFFGLSIVDTPYGIERFKNNQSSRLNRYGDMGKANDIIPDKKYFDELFRISKNQIIWGYNYLSNLLPSTKEFIFWYKHQPVSSYSDGELAWTSFNKTARCFDYPFFGAIWKDKERIHVTQKPIVLYQWILNNYANTGDKIFDSHLGSGSSRIAAYKMGFDFYACEIDKETFDKQEERFKKECFGEIKTKNGTLVQTSFF